MTRYAPLSLSQESNNGLWSHIASTNVFSFADDLESNVGKGGITTQTLPSINPDGLRRKIESFLRSKESTGTSGPKQLSIYQAGRIIPLRIITTALYARIGETEESQLDLTAQTVRMIIVSRRYYQSVRLPQTGLMLSYYLICIVPRCSL